MLFTLVICHLIFCINFSLEAKLGDGQPHYHSKNKAADDSKQEMKNLQNETNESDNFIEKSQLDELIRLKNENMVKNYIEEFENHYAIYFEPNWTQVDRTDSPARQNIGIRRQKWEYILDEAKDTIFVKFLKSELEKSNLNRTAFCKEIAETYFTLSNSSLLLESASNLNENSDPLQKESILAFMRTISDLGLNQDDKRKDTVQLPRSIWLELLHKDAHDPEIEKLKKYHEDRVQRLKDIYKRKMRHLREFDPDSWNPSDRYGSDTDSSINSEDY